MEYFFDKAPIIPLSEVFKKSKAKRKLKSGLISNFCPEIKFLNQNFENFQKNYGFFQNFSPISNFSLIFRTFSKLCFVNISLRKSLIFTFPKKHLTNPESSAIILWQKGGFPLQKSLKNECVFLHKSSWKSVKIFMVFSLYFAHVLTLIYYVFQRYFQG